MADAHAVPRRVRCTARLSAHVRKGESQFSGAASCSQFRPGAGLPGVGSERRLRLTAELRLMGSQRPDRAPGRSEDEALSVEDRGSGKRRPRHRPALGDPSRSPDLELGRRSRRRHQAQTNGFITPAPLCEPHEDPGNSTLERVPCQRDPSQWTIGNEGEYSSPGSGLGRTATAAELSVYLTVPIPARLRQPA